MTDALRRIDKVRQIRRAIGLTIGAAIYSAGLNLFLIPNHVIDGGVTGISSDPGADGDPFQRAHCPFECSLLLHGL